ncbi:MAG TPA: iron-sulfur cluster assembly scaffold protein [Terriglobales bacterium]
MYSAKLLDHFQNPRNTGQVESPDATIQIENPACGDVLKLTARIVDRRIAEIRFQAKGCVPAMACASLLTEMTRGHTVEEALKLCAEDIDNEIGGLPEASSHASHLCVDALRRLLQGY